MVSKKANDATNEVGEDTQTEVSNKESNLTPDSEHTKGKDKKQKIEQTHEQVTDDIMHHPHLVNPLDDTRIDIKSGFAKDLNRIKGDDHEYEYDVVILGAGRSW